MSKIDEKIERFEKYREENINLDMLTKDSRIHFSPQMGSNEWQPTKITDEKSFMTATIMSSEKRRTTKSPNRQSSNNVLLKDKKPDNSKSPVGGQKSIIDNKTDRQKAKESTLDRLAKPKNITQPFTSRSSKDRSKDKSKSRSKSPNLNINSNNNNPVLSKALDNKIKNENNMSKHNKPKLVKNIDEPTIEVYYKERPNNLEIKDDFRELNMDSK